MLMAIGLAASSVYSCSCADPSEREKFRKADFVFLGQIVQASERKGISNDDYFINSVDFKVENQWKGSKKSALTVFVSIDIPGMCGDMPLNIGWRYLVYAYRRKEGLVTYADCGPNIQAEFAKPNIKNLNSFSFRLRARTWPFG